MNGKHFLVLTLAVIIALSSGLAFAGRPAIPVRVIVDSETDGDRGVKAIDGDPNTMWHTRHGDGETKHPHEITIDLTRSFELAGFAYQPRADGGNGTIKDYEFYVSDDANDFGQPVAKGQFADGGTEKQVEFPEKKKGRFVRLRALSETKGQPWASIGELRLLSDGVQFISDGGPWDPDAPATVEKPRRTGTVYVKVKVNSQTLDTEGFRAMDGNRSTIWRTAWQPERRRHPHEITIDLEESSEIAGFIYTPCYGGGNGTIKDYEFYVSEDENNFGSPAAKGTFDNNDAEKKVELAERSWGRYVKLRALSEVNGQPWASIAELRILSEGVEFRAAPLEPEETAVLKELAQRGHRPPDGSLQDVLDLALRTLEFVERRASQPRLASELRALEKQIGGGGDQNALRERLLQVRRKIILAHPDLNFRQLLVNKRPPPGYSHMCDQYLGRHSRSGPGLAVIDDWKNNPRSKLILEGKLPEGSVLHPDLSYDGRRVLFSFCDHTIEDTKQRRFLIYETSIDGLQVRQITGTENDSLHCWGGRQTVLIEDFDPCYLPDGGFAFITTRNQSFGRCHGSRYVPAYMLFRANLDGGGIRQLSFGEANEWDPSVMHNGRIVYTRWDYINRHDTRFQSLWTIAPDGTGTAHYYGNYSSSPCMTAEARAVPNSHQIVCTATAHHGYTSGSTILIDPHKGQDGPEPLTRVTCEFRFPEAGDRYAGGIDGASATPWPLNENMYLVASMYGRLVGQGGVQDVNAYAIYLVDTLGGRELIYRDEQMSCFSPIPIRQRPTPPAVPSHIVGREHEKTGTFFVQNVYQSTQPIEPGSIKHLRINRIYGQPNNSKPSLSLANNEIIKGIVGTVPVSTDGSVAFNAPTGTPLQLQLLDENGMAVMTMRSAIYLQPGETATCVGCHEHRSTTPRPGRLPGGMPIHDPKPPAGPQYAGGFSFMRTVQPVLDRYCIECHGLKRKDADLDLLGTREGTYNVAHDSLTGRAGWVKIAYRNQETAFSTAKDYFAHAGKLAKYLLEDHQNRVKLDRESFQRIVDWLDLNTQFYGDYSRNRVEDRRISSEGEKALREHIKETFGVELAKQPLAALVNVAIPSESRILKAPLATGAGGWGQIAAGGWQNTGQEGYQEMLRLVKTTVVPREAHDIAGTCGREHCSCGTCWTRRIREALENPPVQFNFPPFPKDPPDKNEAYSIPKDRWRVVRVDSEETTATDASAARAFDENPLTYWHTQSEGQRPAHPHEIVIDLGRTHRVCGFRYLPRNGTGDIKDCEFFVSDDPSRLGQRVVKGSFTDRRAEQTVLVDARPGRYVMLRALSSADGSPYTSAREFSVLTPDAPPREELALGRN